jgi:hypothetical protein
MDTAVERDRADPGRGRPRWATRWSFLAMMAALIGPGAPAQDNANSRARSAARLEAMRRLARDIKVREIDNGKPGPPLPLRLEPLLRYSDPERNCIDGTLWGWGERGRGRPPAVMKLELRGPGRGRRHWALNVSAVSPRPIEVEFADGVTWASRPPGLAPRPVPDAPAPADTAGQRLTQAKSIARRVSIGVETNTIGRIQLRLLTTPIDSYHEDEAGLLYGVLFEFVYATNPVVALALEARSENDGGRTWRYAFARQGVGQATALLDGRSVWSVPTVVPPVDSDTYMTRPMPAGPADQD